MSEQVEVPSGRMTVDAFIVWTDQMAQRRFELLDGWAIAMAPEQLAHTRAKFAVAIALREAIRHAGLPCEALPDGVTVRIDESTAYEPDAVVHCGKPAANQTVLPDPIIVVEVTSPSNSRVDLITKLADYFRVPSIRHYLVVHLAKRLVMHHSRGTDGSITKRLLPSGPLTLDPPGITVQVESLFED